MLPSEILTKAKELIADPANWCQEGYSKDEIGRVTATYLGCQWCAMGALWRICDITKTDRFHDHNKDGTIYLRKAAAEQATSHGIGDIAHINDHLGHAAVMVMYDRAIALAKESESQSNAPNS